MDEQRLNGLGNGSFGNSKIPKEGHITEWTMDIRVELDTRFFVSPAGGGVGTRMQPASLSTALDRGKDFWMLGGIYLIDQVQVPDDVVVSAVEDERPILMHSQGYPPPVEVGENSKLFGLWFGGAQDLLHPTELHPGVRSVIQDCFFFNYVEAIGEGAATQETILRNVFVNCGLTPLKHTMYLENDTPGHTVDVSENIVIGGVLSYQFHCWHDPVGISLRNNFSGAADHCLAFQGSNHICDHNVWWKPVSPGSPIDMSQGPNRVYTKNYHGPIASKVWLDGQKPAGLSMAGNLYYTGTATYDLNPVFTQDGDEVGYLGKSAAEIDAAILGLQTSFSKTVQQIQDDQTIGSNLDVLRSVIDRWKNV